MPVFVNPPAEIVRRKRMEARPIEDLIDWTYRRQRADIVMARSTELHDIEAQASGIVRQRQSADGVAAGERIVRLGTKVDGGIIRGVGRDLHPDAETIHMTVLKLQAPTRHLIIDQARQGGAPDWIPDGTQLLVPVLTPKGKPRIMWTDPPPAHNFGYCVIEPNVSDAFIQMTRDIYAVWHSALALVAAQLRDQRQMTRYWPQHPSLNPKPWERA